MGGKIFISYRREDSEGYAGRIFDHLTKYFGADRVFMDVDSIALGDNFAEVIEEAVGSSSVFIALIGNRWMSAVDEKGELRLNNPEDFVRMEIASALRKKDTQVIPVLIHNATIPSSSALPDDLAPLTFRNAMNISHARFTADVDRLTDEIERYFEKTGGAKKPSNKKTQFSIPIWGWISLAVLSLLLIIFAVSGGFNPDPVETPLAQVPETSSPTPTDIPTASGTPTQIPPTSTEKAVPAVEIISTETSTLTPTLIPTVLTSIMVQRGETSAEMILVADCLLDEDGKYNEENCDLTLKGEGLDGAFFIDAVPVTNGQFAAFLNQNGYDIGDVRNWFDYDHHDGGVAINSDGVWYRKEGFENFPVIAVSWDWAEKFCSYYGGGLPSQDEWIMAARGNGNFFYPWGNNTVNSSYANYSNRIDKPIAVKSNAKNVSPFGVWDMAGNVWEWTNTQVNDKFSLKGGSYISNDFLLRVDQRKIESPDVLSGDFGFRCMCSPADACYSALVPTSTPNP